MADGTGDVGGGNSIAPGFDFIGTSQGGDRGSDLDGLDTYGSIDPANVGGGSGDNFDPNVHVGRDKLNADGSYRRKRGKRGSGSNAKSSPRKASSKTSVEGIETILVGIHAMAAAALAPELALETDESKPYASAIAEVAKHYNVPEVADKTLAWVGLIMVMGGIYGPRAVLIRERMKAEKAKNITDGDPNIVPFHPTLGQAG